MNSKNKDIGDLYRGINEFKNDYQPISNIVMDGNGDLLADSHSNRCRKYFSQLLNVHSVSGVGQIEVHTAEPLVPDPICLDVEIAVAIIIIIFISIKSYRVQDVEKSTRNKRYKSTKSIWL
jgi:hypothetical protein